MAWRGFAKRKAARYRAVPGHDPSYLNKNPHKENQNNHFTLDSCSPLKGKRRKGSTYQFFNLYFKRQMND